MVYSLQLATRSIYITVYIVDRVIFADDIWARRSQYQRPKPVTGTKANAEDGWKSNLKIRFSRNYIYIIYITLGLYTATTNVLFCL
jgi:hypothetical protein